MRLQLTHSPNEENILKNGSEKMVRRQTMSFHRHRCRRSMFDVLCVHYRFVDDDGVYDVVVFIVFIFIYFDVVAVAVAISYSHSHTLFSLSLDGFLFSRYLLWEMMAGMEITIIIIFFFLWKMMHCRRDEDGSCGVAACDAPKSNRMLDARDVRFRFVVEDNLIFRFIVLEEATSKPDDDDKICER